LARKISLRDREGGKRRKRDPAARVAQKKAETETLHSVDGILKRGQQVSAGRSTTTKKERFSNHRKGRMGSREKKGIKGTGDSLSKLGEEERCRWEKTCSISLRRAVEKKSSEPVSNALKRGNRALLQKRGSLRGLPWWRRSDVQGASTGKDRVQS